MMAGATLLSVEGLESHYGPVRALGGISLEVKEGEIVTLIGANGAGKSTLLMTICGDPRASAGRVLFDGADITRMATHDIMRLGIAHAPEGRCIFPRMSVLENLQIGATPVGDAHLDEDMETVFNLFPILRERVRQRGGTLSGGEQQMLAMGRALMAGPKLIMMDEPSTGLAPLIVKDIFRIILRLREAGNTVLLVEQNAKAALAIADRGYVLETGKIILQGPAVDLLNNADVQRAYLGRDVDSATATCDIA
jgi:branched-chain amino acid transport system ATP-binding protein